MPRFMSQKLVSSAVRPPRFSEVADKEATAQISDGASSETDLSNALDSDIEDESSDNASGDGENDAAVQQRLSKVSFGMLAKAQNELNDKNNRKRKRGEETNPEHQSKLDAIRERLREIRENKGRNGEVGATIVSGDEKSIRRQDRVFEDEDEETDSGSDSASDSEDMETKGRKRTSKHAPTAMPANRAVSRYRDVVQAPKIKSRDPRFDATSGHLDRNAISSRYSFLNEYQADELTSLKKALKNKKAKFTEDEREKLQRKVVSMESKMATNKAREREERVRREHRKQERDAVEQGKKPFYLKKSEVRQQALVDRFEGMKSRQKDKVIQRRRKKLAAKEWKDMPTARRV